MLQKVWSSTQKPKESRTPHRMLMGLKESRRTRPDGNSARKQIARTLFLLLMFHFPLNQRRTSQRLCSLESMPGQRLA